MTYMTLVDTTRANAARHQANGDRWLADGKPDYAAGSYRKAERNRLRADQLEFWRFPDAPEPVRNLLTERMERMQRMLAANIAASIFGAPQ